MKYLLFLLALTSCAVTDYSKKAYVVAEKKRFDNEGCVYILETINSKKRVFTYDCKYVAGVKDTVKLTNDEFGNPIINK